MSCFSEIFERLYQPPVVSTSIFKNSTWYFQLMTSLMNDPQSHQPFLLNCTWTLLKRKNYDYVAIKPTFVHLNFNWNPRNPQTFEQSQIIFSNQSAIFFLFGIEKWQILFCYNEKKRLFVPSWTGIIHASLSFKSKEKQIKT